MAYIKPYLSKSIGHIFHGITGTSGVMTVDSLSYVMVDDCLFIENSAMHAGVLLVHNASVTINNSKFIDNKTVLLRERKRHTARKRAQDADPPPRLDLTPPC